MDRNLVSYGLQYAGYIIEAGLVLCLAWTGQWRRLRSAAFYLTCLLAAELMRAIALHNYGFGSLHYFYVYWSTDFLLVGSAFLLVCLFFRRACQDQGKLWRLVRGLLLLVFVLVLVVSGLCFSHNYSHLFTYFIIEFNQNLYFTCLVLNTLLYILLQQIQSTDEELVLLVCGVGIQFAGPTATLALVHVTTGESIAQSLAYLAIPLCTLGMLLVWAYSFILAKKGKAIRLRRPEMPVLAEATAAVRLY